MEAGTLQGLAWRAVEQGNPSEAVEFTKQSYPINRELGELPAIASDFLRLGRAMVELDRPRAAAALFGRMQLLREDTGTGAEQADTDAAVSAARQRLPDDEFTEAWDRGASMTLDEVFEHALSSRD